MSYRFRPFLGSIGFPPLHTGASSNTVLLTATQTLFDKRRRIPLPKKRVTPRSLGGLDTCPCSGDARPTVAIDSATFRGGKMFFPAPFAALFRWSIDPTKFL